MLISKPNNNAITKNNDKIWTSSKPNKLYIIRKVLIRAIQNVLFIEFKPLCQALWAFLSNFGSFYDARSPNMVMSHDRRCKFLKFFNFVLILHLILGKVTKFLLEKLSSSEVISKNLTGDGKPSPKSL